MAIQSGTFTFSLPEDVDTTLLHIYEASTEGGAYTLVTSVAYEYGVLSYEYDSLDDTKWYKIKFQNGTDSEYGPLSDAVYGGDFSKAAPFLAVSTSTDGANYASIQDVYEYANLTAEDVTSSKISKALKRARAVIDLRTADLDLNRFDIYPTEIARKKYNATLRILKEAEINIALGHLYRGLADDEIMARNRDTASEEPAISLGATSISDTSSSRAENTPRLMAISDRYLSIGAAMVDSIQPTSCRMTTREPDNIRYPRFKRPFGGWK